MRLSVYPTMPNTTLAKKIAQSEKVNLFDLEKGVRIYTFLNPVSYLTALKKVSLFESMDGIFADGMLLVWAIRLFYGKKVKRKSFDMTSLAPMVFRYANDHHLSVCIVATHQNLLEKAIGRLKELYPSIIWKGCRNGYFSGDEEESREAKCIAELNPDILIVGMGIGNQERFLLNCKIAGFKGVGYTCGGFIHQIADQNDLVNYYPKWVDKYDLRFVYRMYREPYTIKRYAKAALVFPVAFFKEWLLGKKYGCY